MIKLIYNEFKIFCIYSTQCPRHVVNIVRELGWFPWVKSIYNWLYVGAIRNKLVICVRIVRIWGLIRSVQFVGGLVKLRRRKFKILRVIK